MSPSQDPKIFWMQVIPVICYGLWFPFCLIRVVIFWWFADLWMCYVCLCVCVCNVLPWSRALSAPWSLMVRLAKCRRCRTRSGDPRPVISHDPRATWDMGKILRPSHTPMPRPLHSTCLQTPSTGIRSNVTKQKGWIEESCCFTETENISFSVQKRVVASLIRITTFVGYTNVRTITKVPTRLIASWQHVWVSPKIL